MYVLAHHKKSSEVAVFHNLSQRRFMMINDSLSKYLEMINFTSDIFVKC